jgi:hypothetical protein
MHGTKWMAVHLGSLLSLYPLRAIGGAEGCLDELYRPQGYPPDACKVKFRGEGKRAVKLSVFLSALFVLG